jgi:hypothetical protein
MTILSPCVTSSVSLFGFKSVISSILWNKSDLIFIYSREKLFRESISILLVFIFILDSILYDWFWSMVLYNWLSFFNFLLNNFLFNLSWSFSCNYTATIFNSLSLFTINFLRSYRLFILFIFKLKFIIRIQIRSINRSFHFFLFFLLFDLFFMLFLFRSWFLRFRRLLFRWSLFFSHFFW